MFSGRSAGQTRPSNCMLGSGAQATNGKKVSVIKLGNSCIKVGGFTRVGLLAKI